jgi:hypothetical protein
MLKIQMFWDGMVARLVRSCRHSEGLLCYTPSDTAHPRRSESSEPWANIKLTFKGFCHLTWALQIHHYEVQKRVYKLLVLSFWGWICSSVWRVIWNNVYHCFKKYSIYKQSTWISIRSNSWNSCRYSKLRRVMSSSGGSCLRTSRGFTL